MPDYSGSCAAGDPYLPYRRIVSPHRIRELSTLKPWRAVTDIIMNWTLILVAFGFVAIHPVWWAVLVAIPVIGNRYYALFIIGHHAMHRRLFPNIKRNDLWADLLIFAPIGAITRLNNRNHLVHHLHLATLQDPDRFKHACFNKGNRVSLLTFLFGLGSVGHALKAVFLTRGRTRGEGRESGSSASGGYTLRDFTLLFGWFVIAAGGLTLLIGWWAYPVLWLLPVYTFMYLADNFRSSAEHSHFEGDDSADRHRLVTYTSNPIERMLVAPMNMNYHTAHHLWPSIPYYNLPEADREIRHSSGVTELEWRTSYFGYLLKYWSALPIAECLRGGA